MSFTDAERGYLGTQRLGRLATVQPDGTPQVSPVGFSLNHELGTIDIGGFSMSTSQKYRNVTVDPRVAFVVDDIASIEPWRVRCLEVRGVAEAVPDPSEPAPGRDRSLIRIHPRRIISFGLDQPDTEPHLLTPRTRNVT
ncbi:MAG TPA: PPOX class F420-dependent oxidoreductase [Acidimicrobiales bacterium]|jgi:pyridoxamine 5'-phosphate oxidase family protein